MTCRPDHQVTRFVCMQGEGKIDYDEFVAVICKSWERAQETDRLSTWIKKHYNRLETGTKKFKETHTPIFQSGKEESCFGLCRSRPKGVSAHGPPAFFS